MALGLSRRRAPHARRAPEIAGRARRAPRRLPLGGRACGSRCPALHVRSFDIASSSTPVVFFCTSRPPLGRRGARGRHPRRRRARVLDGGHFAVGARRRRAGRRARRGDASAPRLWREVRGDGSGLARGRVLRHQAHALLAHAARGAQILLLRCLREYRAFWQLVSAGGKAPLGRGRDVAILDPQVSILHAHARSPTQQYSLTHRGARSRARHVAAAQRRLVVARLPSATAAATSATAAPSAAASTGAPLFPGGRKGEARP